MRKYVRIEDGTVREKIILADAADITKRYHPSLIWVETTGLSPQPKESWLYDGVAFSPPLAQPTRRPKPDAPLTAEELAAHLVSKRTITQAEIDAIKAER